MSSSRTVRADKTVFLDERREVFAIGDIHGDMDALIICLRDCCKVIKKKERIPFDSKVRDVDLVNLMNMETIETYEGYKLDLNYEWIGRDKIIIFTGDLLDGYRKSNIYNGYNHIGEHPLEELKIFFFLLAMRSQALKNNCEVLLILGNHEIMNIFGQENRYISEMAKTITTTYAGTEYDRSKYFKYDGFGAKLIGFSGFRFFVVVNNILFLHSGISGVNINYDTLTRFGTDIKQLVKNKGEPKNIDAEEEEAITNFVFSRAQSDYNDWGNRHTDYDDVSDDVSDDVPDDVLVHSDARMQKVVADRFCKQTDNLIGNFCNPLACGEQRQNILVVGHEVQTDFVQFRDRFDNSGNVIDRDTKINLFTETIERTSTATEYIPMEYTPPFKEFRVKNYENETREDYHIVPGVNVECVHSNDPRYASIYKIDVGMSRAFDFGHSLMSNYKSEFIRRNPRLDVEPTTENIDKFTTANLYDNINVEDNVYFSEYVFTLMRARCPTVLHIKFVPDEQITVVRSTLKNTLIHQPRPNNIDYPTWMIEEFLAGDFRLNPDLQ